MRISSVVILLLATGCVDFGEPVEGEDDNVFFPSFRATWQIAPEKARAKKGNTEGERTASEPIAGSFALDFDFSYGGGSSSQNLPSGEVLRFGGTRFTGPARVSHDYDLYVFTVAPRGGLLIYDTLAIEGMIGGGFNYFDLELESAGTSESGDRIAGGPLFGTQITWRLPDPLRWASLYGRASVLVGFGDADTQLNNLEAGIIFNPTSTIGIMAGWRRWEYFEEFNGSDADVDLVLSGPMAGLQITF